MTNQRRTDNSEGGRINITSNVEGVDKVTLIHEVSELLHWKESSIFYIDPRQTEK